jgi:hypothetical protein
MSETSNTLFITAARQKYRFPSPVGGGGLTVEQLFDLPLTATGNRASLDSVARETNRLLKEQTEESFVETRSNPLKTELSNKLEIVKAIIAIRQEEQEAARLRTERAEKRQRLLAAIEAAENRTLSEASVDDLRKQLAELD